MAPLGYAVGFINGKQCQLAAAEQVEGVTLD